MNFYKNILRWKLSMMEAGDSPVGNDMPAPKDSIMHSSLTQGGKVIMSSDLHSGEKYSNGNGLQIYVNCETGKESTDFFMKLSAGGEIFQP